MTKHNIVTIQTRIDENLKEQADKIFEAMGLKMSEAIRMFVKQSINIGGLPFQPRAAEKTIAAIAELENKKGKKVKNSKKII